VSERFHLERLARSHDRSSFRCSADEGTLQRYFTDDSRALREHERGVCTVHVLLDDALAPPKIAGYFTLASETIVPAELPAAIAKKYPRYPRWGAVKLGRMARDDGYAGEQLGVTLVRAAFDVVLRSDAIGAIAMVVDAKNVRLARWYQNTCGFTPFAERPLTLFIMKTTMQITARV